LIINNLRNETGSSLLFIIISIIVLGVLGAGMVSLFTSSTISVFTPNNSLKARYMAESGIRYADGAMSKATDLAAVIQDLTTRYTLENEAEKGFNLEITQIGESSSYTITSTGFWGTGKAASYIKLSDTWTPTGGSGADPWEKDAKNVFYGGDGMSIAGNANVEGSISTAKDFSISGSGKLKGDVNAGEDVSVSGSGIVDGNIVSGGKVNVNGSGQVTGNIDAQGDVILTGNVTVAGNITTTGNVVIEGSSKVLGTINAQGNVIFTGNVTVAGNITNTGNVVIEGTVHGTINAGGTVTIQGNGNVYGNIITGGDVTLTNGKAHGNVDSGGDITLTWSGSIGGNATAAGNVIFPARSKISGSIFENTASPPRLVPEDPEAPEEYYESTLQLPDILFTAGETDICGTGTPLTPGKYGELTTNGSCKDIYLKPGKYYFKKINVTDSQTTLYLDLSEATEEEGIEIFVVGDADFKGSKFTVKVSTDGISYEDSTDVDKALAAHVYLETRGNFYIASEGHWFGAVYAWGKLTVSSGRSSYIGSFYLRDLNKLEVYSDVQIILVPSNYIKHNWEHDGE